MGQKRQTTLRRRHQEADKSGAPDPKDVLLRIAHAGGEVTDADRCQLFRVDSPRCAGCRVNNRESPNCLCGLVPPRGSHRKTGLWRKLSDALADLGDDPGQRLRPLPLPSPSPSLSLATASSSSQPQTGRGATAAGAGASAAQQQSRDLSKASKAGESLARQEEVPSPGLTNLGATCYVNSVLQCLFRTPGFLSGLFGCSPHSLQSHPVLRELGTILAQLQSGRLRVVDTGQLAEALRLDSALQQDGQEFMKLLLELTENLLGAEGGFISRLFSGSLSYVTKCAVCQQASESSSKLVAFVELELNVARLGSLEESVANYFQAEELSGENQYLCGRCARKTDAERAVVLKRLPQILMLQLKRFVFDPKTYSRKKVTSPMTFPLELDLHALGCADALQPTPEEQELGAQHCAPSTEYELTGILLHKGSAASSGHYVAHVRDTSSPLGQWWKCDDEEVTPCGDWPFPTFERDKEREEREKEEKEREKEEEEEEEEMGSGKEEGGEKGKGKGKGKARGGEKGAERGKERQKGRGVRSATNRAASLLEGEEAESEVEEIEMARENEGDTSDDREQQGHEQGGREAGARQGKGTGRGRQRQKTMSMNGLNHQPDKGPRSAPLKGHDRSKSNPKTAPAAPCKSSEAYMLVYSSKAVLARAWARQEPAPSPPEFLAHAVAALEAEVAREGEGFERVRRETEERVVRRQQEVRAVLQEMPVPADERAFHWIATDWLKAWADSASDPPPVDNGTLLCASHGKVAHHNVTKMKRISEMAWAQLVSQFNGGPSLSDAECCDACILEESQSLACASSFQDERNQMRSLVEANLQQRLLGAPRDCFYVSKAWLSQWLRRTKVNAPQPSDADPLGGIVCAHGRLTPEGASGARRVLVCSTAWEYFARVAREAAEMGSEGEEGEGEREGEDTEGKGEGRKGEEWGGEADGTEKGGGKGGRGDRDRGRGEGKEVCPLAGVPGTAEACTLCRQEWEQGAEEEAQLRESKLVQQKEFQELFSTRPLPLHPGVCYCILASEWVSSWRSYLAALDAKSLKGGQGQAPGSLQECRDICVCAHGKLIQPVKVVQKKQGIHLDPQGFWVATSEETWQKLCQQWGCRQEDAVMLQVNEDIEIDVSCSGKVDAVTEVTEGNEVIEVNEVVGMSDGEGGIPSGGSKRAHRGASGDEEPGAGGGKTGAGGEGPGAGGESGEESERDREGSKDAAGEEEGDVKEVKGPGVRSTRLTVQTVPEVCPTCAHSSTNGRVVSEYRNEKISVQLAPGNKPPASLTRPHGEKPSASSRRSKRARRGANVAPLTVSSDTTVWKLKLLVWEALEVVPENQWLGFEMRELTDGGMTLKDAGIFPGAVLWLVDTKIHEDRDIAECVTNDVEVGQEVGFRGSLLLQGSHALPSGRANETGGEAKADNDEGQDGVPKRAAAGRGAPLDTEEAAVAEGARGGEEGGDGEGAARGQGAEDTNNGRGYKEEPQGSGHVGSHTSARSEKVPLKKEANKVHLPKAGAGAPGGGGGLGGGREFDEDPMEWTPPPGDEDDESELED